jgi:hypothetical protein
MAIAYGFWLLPLIITLGHWLLVIVIGYNDGYQFWL